MSEAELAALPNLGPASARWLVGAGIGTVAELRRVGPVAAFNRVALREGRCATANLLYALYAALEDKYWPLVRLPCIPDGAGPSLTDEHSIPLVGVLEWKARWL